MSKDTLSDFAKHTISKADFFDFPASIFYSQGCSLCRAIQGLVLVASTVIVSGLSWGVVSALATLRTDGPLFFSFFGGCFIGAAMMSIVWLIFFAAVRGAVGGVEKLEEKRLRDMRYGPLPGDLGPMGSPDIGVSVDDSPIHTVDVETAATNGDNMVDPK